MQDQNVGILPKNDDLSGYAIQEEWSEEFARERTHCSHYSVNEIKMLAILLNASFHVIPRVDAFTEVAVLANTWAWRDQGSHHFSQKIHRSVKSTNFVCNSPGLLSFPLWTFVIDEPSSLVLNGSSINPSLKETNIKFSINIKENIYSNNSTYKNFNFLE